MNVKVTGVILAINETQTVGASGFQKREIVVKQNEGEYPQTYSLQFVQDKCGILDKYKVGEIVSIDADLRGREWTNKEGVLTAFNTMQGWKIDYAGAHADAIHDQTLTAAQMGDDSDQDLPF